MKPSRASILLIEIIVALFVLLFLYTALSKLKDLSGFEGAMRHSPLAGPSSYWLKWAVPAAELVVTALLIIPRARLAGLMASTILMCIFTVYIAYMMITAETLPCTCGGIISTMSWRDHLVLNAAFVVLGLIAIFLQIRNLIMINRSSRIPV